MAMEADFDIIRFVEGDMPETALSISSLDSGGSNFLSEDEILGILGEDIFNGDPAVSTPKGSDNKTCPVCGRPAGKHYYYGAQVCVSCRGFFRRTVQNNHQTIFQCLGDLNCVIDSKSRKSCKFCRFQKCLDAGMNPAYVLSDSERKDRIVRKYRSKTEANTIIMPMLKTQEDLSMIYTQEEHLYYNKEYKSFINHSYTKCLEFFVNRLDEFKCYHENMIFKTPLSPEKLKLMMRLDEVTITTYCLELNDCFELSFHDRMTLVKNNFPAIYALVWAVYGQDYDAQEYFLTFFNVIKKRAETDEQYGPLADLAEELLSSIKESICSSLNDILPSDMLREESKKITFDQETKKIQNWSTPNGGTKTGPDHNIILIFYKILLFGTDFTDRLDDPAKIGAIQNKYLWQLHRYIKTQFRNKSYAFLHETAMISLSIKSISNVLEEVVK